MSLIAAAAFTVAAMYRLEQVGDASAFSPSGSRVAFVVKRPLHDARNVAQAFLEDDDVADVYVADLRTGRVRRITDGSTDGSGFWAPQWSPDGRRIAMLSTRGGNVFLWTWDPAHGLQRVTDRAVDAYFGNSGFTWVSDDRVVCSLLPAGQKPLSMIVEDETPMTAMHAWPLDWRGRVSTANVLESGTAANVGRWPQSALVVLDLAGARERMTTLATAMQFRDITVSHDRRSVAALAAVDILQPAAGRRLPSDFDSTVYALSVYDVRSGARTARFPERFVGTAPLRWSAHDDAIAAMDEPATTAFKSHLRIDRCPLSAQRCTDVLPPALSVDLGPNGAKSAPFWTADGTLLFAARPANAPIETARTDWYAAGATGSPVNLTSALHDPPGALVALDGGRRFAGIAGGALVTTNGSVPFAPLANAPGRLTAIVWPSGETPGTTIVAARGSRASDLSAIDARTGRATPLAHLRANESLNAFTPRGLALVTAQSADDGSFLRESAGGGAQRVLYAANAWLARYAAGRLVHYAYQSTAGRALTAWILLPPHALPGHPVPAVVWVYAGSVMSPNREPYLASLNLVHALNMQLLAARGYAVIFPSMPLPPFGVPSDPYSHLTDGVLPAIDRAVQLGYVDGNRVAVMGQSYGGFSTYGLITQTNRFKAAIALAGISDWTSLYGTIDARQRYRDRINETDQFSEALMEDGQGNFGAPPWEAPERYARNSPLTYVANVHTPLLIVQGDLDYVSVTQGEEFFTALYRLGRRAEFARYWGEEHVFRSEANIADCWRRIGAWLDEFLR